jgi:hypothetical protein
LSLPVCRDLDGRGGRDGGCSSVELSFRSFFCDTKFNASCVAPEPGIGEAPVRRDGSGGFSGPGLMLRPAAFFLSEFWGQRGTSKLVSPCRGPLGVPCLDDGSVAGASERP